MSRELCDLIYTLKTQRLRHRKDAGSFCRAGGVSSLVRMLPVSEETRDHILLLSTIANVCWLDGNAKTQVCNTTASFGPSRTYNIHGVCVHTALVFSHTHLILLFIFFFLLQVMNHGLEEIGMRILRVAREWFDAPCKLC